MTYNVFNGTLDSTRFTSPASMIKMPLGMGVGLSPGDFVLDGDPVLPSQ